MKKIKLLLTTIVLLSIALLYTSCPIDAATIIALTDDTVETPVISPGGGDFSSNQTVTIVTNTKNAKIYYTIDGSDPSTSSTFYTGATFSLRMPATKGQTITVKAIAIKTGDSDSAIASATFTKK